MSKWSKEPTEWSERLDIFEVLCESADSSGSADRAMGSVAAVVGVDGVSVSGSIRAELAAKMPWKEPMMLTSRSRPIVRECGLGKLNGKCDEEEDAGSEGMREGEGGEWEGGGGGSSATGTLRSVSLGLPE